MSDIPETKNVNNDEIDLLDLFRRMGKTLNRWFRALGRAFIISFFFLFKRWLPLSIAVIAGAFISYFLKSTSDSFYTSDMVLRNNLSQNRRSGITAEIIGSVNKLHLYCKEKNKEELKSLLSEDSESVENIIDISAYWIIDKNKNGIPDYVDYDDNHNVYDTTNIRMQDRFDIRVKIRSPQKLAELRKHIISYINNDSLFQERNIVRLEQDKALLTRYNYDISQLDSLQKVKYFEETRNIAPKSGGQIIFMQEQKTQLVYPDIYDLFSRKLGIETDLTLYSQVVTVLSDFSLPTIRENGTIYYAKKIIPFFFCLTLLVLILLANRRKLKEVYNKYKV